MALRFQKRFKIAPGVRLNLSRSGISTTVGKKGLSLTATKSGTHLNAGLPGTGLSSRTPLTSSVANPDMPPGPDAPKLERGSWTSNMTAAVITITAIGGLVYLIF